MSERSRTVVVLGAGPGGLTTARHLRRLLPEDDRIVVIDRTLDTSLGLSLLWVLRGWRRAKDVRVRIAPSSLPGVEFLEAEVLAIDIPRRAVRTSGTYSINFDVLVIALGSRLDFAAIPGYAPESVHEFYTLEGATALQGRLARLDRGRVVFAVAGTPFKCPAAPFEAALLAADLLRSKERWDRVQVDAFTPDPLPMPVAGPAVGEGLVAMLKQHEVGFHPNRTVASVDTERREIRFADGGGEEYDLLAVVPAHRPPQVVEDLGLGQGGWIPVDARSLATGLDGVWALGDATVLKLPNGKPLPKAAVFAEGQAEVVANAVARDLGVSAPEPWYDGRGSCYIELGGRIAAKGEGDFLAEPSPVVTLYEPSKRFHNEKRWQEKEWLQRWTS